MSREPWTITGEMALSCNCTIFCPCVLSLGQHPPTEGYCQTWAGIRIEKGHCGDTDLSDLKLGLVMEIPGIMARGNWTAGVFIDDRASVYAVNALTKIFSGRAGGSTSLLSILVGNFLGVRQAAIEYEIKDKTRIVKVDNYIDGAITPISGQDGSADVVISNSKYWVASEITVCHSDKSRMRAFGRNWNFAGRSAELCRLDWCGP